MVLLAGSTMPLSHVLVGPRHMKKAQYLYFVMPALVLVSVVLFYPLGYALYYSFFSYTLGALPEFVGFRNYLRVLLDPGFRDSLVRSLYFTIGVVSLQFLLGLILALLLDKIAFGKRFFSVVVFIPVMITPAATGLIFRWMFVPQWGIINQALQGLSIPPPDWFSSPFWALVSVMIAEVWQFTPLVAIVLFAGLQSIPGESLDAAKVDGASGFQLLWSILLPLLRPLILFVLVMRTMDAWRLFDRIFVMTAGGPGTATETVTLYNFRTTFQLLRVGEGLAVGVWTLISLLGVMVIYLRMMFRDTSES
jgi:multiple sugar transport system permease protein